jgi:hypothetical protein
LFDLGPIIIKNWSWFIEDSHFIFFVVDSSDLSNILNGRKLLYQIYFGKRFGNFVKRFKEEEIIRKNNYYYQEEQDEEINHNEVEDYFNLIEHLSDYENEFPRNNHFFITSEIDENSSLDVSFLF